MPRPVSAQPTEVEMQILRILWELGPSPVREIHKRLEAAKGTNYSTTVKMLAVMLQKGLVKRDEDAQLSELERMRCPVARHRGDALFDGHSEACRGHIHREQQRRQWRSAGIAVSGNGDGHTMLAQQIEGWLFGFTQKIKRPRE